MAKLIPTATRYERPETLTDLGRILNDNAGSFFLMAGGTSLAFSKPAIEQIIDMNRLPLKGCRRFPDGTLEIGALTSVGALERDENAAGFANGLLRGATDKLASTPLRNLITIGGNLAAGFAWSDLPVALLALDARYRLFDAGSPGTAPMDRALPHDGQTSFRKLADSGQMISHILLDGRYANARSAFVKFARTASDLALVTVAITFIPDGHLMRSVRVAVGGLVSTPQRLTEVEALLEGQSPEQPLLEKAGRAANVVARPDTRASAEYRLDVLKTLVTRTCIQASGGDSNEV